MNVNGNRTEYLTAAEIHARVHWPTVLESLGINGELLEIRRGKRSRNAPCPACGGSDRFFFDNRHGRGDYFCNQCGAGDGFKLLERVHGWGFSEARRRVIEAAGLSGSHPVPIAAPTTRNEPERAIAKPTDRVLRLRRECCAVEDCDDAVDYLASRGLWPLPEGCPLRAHAGAEYWHNGQRVGRYPALVADITDVNGELVTVHVTYLKDGKKLEAPDNRKILGKMEGRDGCAARLMPVGEVLGVAEGIETALSASLIDNAPVWAALNTSLLSKFEPPPGVTRLVLYTDRDEAGLTAGLRLGERLQGRLAFEVRIPTAPAKDFNDQLTERMHRKPLQNGDRS